MAIEPVNHQAAALIGAEDQAATATDRRVTRRVRAAVCCRPRVGGGLRT